MALVSRTMWGRWFLQQPLRSFLNSSTSTRTSTSTLPSSPIFLHFLQVHRNAYSIPRLVYKGPVSEEELLEDSSSKVENIDQDRIITVPVRLKKRLDSKMITEGTKSARRKKLVEKSRVGNKTKIIISCKRSEFNHYLGQSYARGGNIETQLASQSWHHHKAAGDWFIIKPVIKAAAFGFGIEDEVTTFEELGVKDDLVTRLKDNRALKPTLIQQLAIPTVLKGSHNLITAETGCGKTLAYMIPLAQQILEVKKRRLKRGPNQPVAVILVPSHELANQIFYVATKLTEGMGVNVKLLQHGNLGSKIANPASEPIDLLISTVHVLSTLMSAGIYGMHKVQHVVLDEADTLLDDSFGTDVVNFLRSFQFYPGERHTHTTQLSLVSATLPRSIESTLSDLVPENSLGRISTPNIHYVMSHVPQHFHRLKKSQKPAKLMEIVQSDLASGNPLMIFCNNAKTCDWMHIMLRGENIPCIAVHGKTRPTVRKGLLDKYQNGDVNVMICTDLGSRGINTVRTRHVLNYEFPMFTADYIHRCGRTGRVGSTGKCQVTNLISRKFEFQVVQEIEKSVRQEVSLTKVDANIKRLLSSRYGMYKPITGNDDDNSDREDD